MPSTLSGNRLASVSQRAAIFIHHHTVNEYGKYRRQPAASVALGPVRKGRTHKLVAGTIAINL